MTARESVMRLINAGMCPPESHIMWEVVDEVLGKHAHELAQQLRDTADELSGADESLALEWRLAAECIDPGEIE